MDKAILGNLTRPPPSLLLFFPPISTCFGQSTFIADERLKVLSYILSLHGVLYGTVLSIDVSQVVVTLFCSFQHFYHITYIYLLVTKLNLLI